MSKTYQQAIEYYDQMKQNFIKQCQEQAQQADAILSAKIATDMWTDLEQAPDISKDYASTAALNNAIEKIYTDVLEYGKASGSELAGLTQKLQSQVWKTQKTANQHMRFWLDTVEGSRIKQRIEEAIWSAAGGTIQGGNINDIYNRVVSIFTRGISSSAKTVSAYVQNEKTMLAGYFHELAVAKATQQLPGILMSHIGTANLQADIVYTIGAGGTNKDPVQQYSNVLARLMPQLSINSTVPLLDGEMFEAYGNQVKSWELSFKKARVQGYNISHQQGLLNSFGGENKSQLDSVRFFKQQNNAVIQTFGPLNVMYFTGKNRWWTSDLISAAVENKYRLMFNQSSRGKLTATVKLDTKAYHWTRLYEADSV